MKSPVRTEHRTCRRYQYGFPLCESTEDHQSLPPIVIKFQTVGEALGYSFQTGDVLGFVVAMPFTKECSPKSMEGAVEQSW